MYHFVWFLPSLIINKGGGGGYLVAEEGEG